jgi:hypothetical protein
MMKSQSNAGAKAMAGDAGGSPGYRLRRAWPLFALATCVGIFVTAQWIPQALRDYRAHYSYAAAQCRVIAADAQHTTTRLNNGAVRDHYHPAVSFSYVVNGQSYQTRGYDNYDGVTSDASVLVSFPVGASVPCWYDPADPASAIVARSFSPQYHASGLIPLFMTLISAGFLTAALRRRSLPVTITTGIGEVLPVRLTPALTHRGTFAGLLFMALAWGAGIAAYAAYLMRGGSMDLLFFGLLAVAAEVQLVRLLVRSARSLASHDPVVELDHEPVRPGETVAVAIRLPGPIALRSATASLVCELNEGNGSKKLHSSLFMKLAEARIDAGDTATHRHEVRIPGDARESQRGMGASITWQIVIKVSAKPGTAATEHEFTFRVQAAQPAGPDRC